MNKYKKITLDGIIFNNPTFILVLGTCPTLGLISSALSALEMGLAVIVILTLSNVIISALRKIIPNEVRIPCYIVVIATLVTLIRMVLDKFLPSVYEALGGFLALIVVNCSIRGRAEAFGLWLAFTVRSGDFGRAVRAADDAGVLRAAGQRRERKQQRQPECSQFFHGSCPPLNCVRIEQEI